MYNSTTGKYDYTSVGVGPMSLGPDSFTYRAFDGTSWSNTATVSLTVTNTAPTTSNIGPLSMPHGQTLNNIDLTAASFDADGDNLMINVVDYPSHGMLMYNGATQMYEYTPTFNFAGTDSFTFRANDQAEDSNLATVTIEVTNTAPIITDVGSDWDFVEGEEVSIQVQATDPDAGDMLTYSAENLPPGLSIDSYSGLISGVVEGHSDPDPTKQYQVRIVVTDNMDETDAFLQAGATAFRVSTVGAITPPAGFTTLGTTPVPFTVTVSGVGAPPAGRSVLWSVLDSDPGANDELQAERIFNTGAGAGATGTWSVTLTFYLHKNTARNVAGADGQSGESSADVFVRIESNEFWDYGSNLGDSAVLVVTVTPP